MKCLIHVVFFCAVINTGYAQTISPAQTGEFCPNIEYTFTASIPKTYQSMIGIGSAVVIQPPASPVGSSFTFKGRFSDANQKQSFRVNYTDGTSYDFEFKRIKSLFFTALSSANPPCNRIQPNQTQPIIFPRCQVTSATISFPNIQWFTTFENPELCFGSVTDYEYLLPTGWKLGNTTSNGSTWIGGLNNVTITSDLFTGNGADIRIRASNKTCGIGLAANGPVSTVRISRPGPTTITGGIPLLCSGNSTYTLNTIPTGATVCWTLSNNSVASIPSTPFCGNSVTVTRIGTGNANTVLTATVSDCSGTYPPINFPIAVGTPGSVSLQVNETAFDFCNSGLMQFDASLQNPAPGTQLSWSVTGSGASIKFSAGGYTPVLNIRRTGSFQLVGTITNACGSTTYSEGPFYGADFYSSYCGATFNKFSVSPNPIKGNMNIIFEQQTKATDVLNVRLYSFNSSSLVKQWTVNGGQAKFSLNTSNLKSGIYTLEISNGSSKVSKQIIIE